ncbi:citrate transporter [Erysipelothrix sp. HDW6C]|uniref:citrate transporter n=1 Tax=Erysipelothrix sp. HDW6C TaxID=2714930 RepID=UPI00140D3088|nr:citrate transporter [Erysipelothrix sp. HDW6C]QIK69399.1 citrate transporter [Erysipelothrix sp. HDW6C]
MKKRGKKLILILTLVFGLLTIATQSIMALEISEIVAPTGFKAVMVIIPLILVLVLLFLKVDMVLAGAIAAGIAMIIGGVSLAEMNKEVLGAIPTMLTITVPIINSAIAMAVFKAGSYTAALELVNRATKGKVEYVSAFLVILVAAATYMSGIGGGSAMVIAPLAFAAVGAIPELIAGMSIAAAVSFTTSPASLETSITSQLGGFEAATYVDAMRPFWLFFLILAIGIAFVGVKRRKLGFKQSENKEYADMSNGKLFKYTIPAIYLLFSVIFGPLISKVFFSPIVYMIVTVLLIVVCTGLDINKAFSSMIEGSNYILTRLFQVGIFLGFINVIASTGTFAVIANVASAAPTAIVVPVAVLTGILIGVPAGAYVGSILTLVLPIGIALGFTPIQLGFITMGVGLGSQMSFVNITMQALSSGFQIPILQVVKGNIKWLSLASVLLVVASFIFA